MHGNLRSTILTTILIVGIAASVANSQVASIRIETVEDAIQGQTQEIDIIMSEQVADIGDFDLLVEYDPTGLVLMGVEVGHSPLYSECAWEYFTYRVNPACVGEASSGSIRIIGIAEINNGSIHPVCYTVGDEGVLATLQFLVSNLRSLECTFAPIVFSWCKCFDNTLFDRNIETLHISRYVFDTLGNDISAESEMPTNFGAPDSCLTNGSYSVARDVDFYNGGIYFICHKEIDDRGDINMDGVAYTTADAVMFSDYFIEGLSAFPDGLEDGSVAASDVNADGYPLTVADFACLVRVVVGDSTPWDGTVDSSSGTVTVIDDPVDKHLWLTSTELLGAVRFVFEGEIVIDSVMSGMDVKYFFDGLYTRAIVCSWTGNAFGSPDGELAVEYHGDGHLVEAEAGTFEGRVVKTDIQVGPELPYEFTLSQNYPNPFNGGTRIPVDLDKPSKATVMVYDITGRKVVTVYDGQLDAGRNEIFWDGEDDDGEMLPSGVYFYRVEALGMTASRKMLLLK